MPNSLIRATVEEYPSSGFFIGLGLIQFPMLQRIIEPQGFNTPAIGMLEFKTSTIEANTAS